MLQDLTVVLSTLLPVVCINNDSKDRSDFLVGLKVFYFVFIFFGLASFFDGYSMLYVAGPDSCFVNTSSSGLH